MLIPSSLLIFDIMFKKFSSYYQLKNKKQIDIVHKLIENNYNLNEIVKLIKWSSSTNKAIDDIISSTVLNIESDSLDAGMQMLSAFLGNTTR